jgi:RHS repeat-associated protein
MSYLSSAYTYDQENRLSSTAGMSYTYDGNGERVLKSNTTTGAAVKRYWSMGGNTLAEGDGSGNLTAEYIYFGGRRVARIDLPANTVHYYLSDHLGSTSVVVSAAGALEEESDYYPFGTEVIVTGPGANELKFTGKRRDTESQLDYFGARYYSNAYGRFLTPDWAAKAIAVPYADFGDPQSLNLYSYVRNNSLAKNDPDGHCPSDDGCSGVTVKVTAETPHMIENQKIGNDYKSGVGTTLTIKFSDSKGPMSGVSVKESNTTGSGKLVENPNSVKTNSSGEIKDVVMRSVVSDTKPVDITNKSTEDAPSHQELADHVNSTPYNSTTTQTLTFDTTDSKGQSCTCQATYDRTLSNTDSKGNVNAQNNSQGVNYNYSNTQPVVKQKDKQ